jgi:hypothetical protein
MDMPPDDIGPMIASLLSEENRWVNRNLAQITPCSTVAQLPLNLKNQNLSTNALPLALFRESSPAPGHHRTRS